VIRQPELLLSKVNAVDVIFCCSALFVLPGLKPISKWDDQYLFFSETLKKVNFLLGFFTQFMLAAGVPGKMFI